MADPDVRPVDAKRWLLAIVRHLEDLPRQYAALEHAMASFGEDFDLQEFKAAYNTSDDMDAYNRVQAVERAIGRVQNYVGELAEAGVKLAALPRPADSRRSSTEIAFEAMRNAKIITARLCSRLVHAERADTHRAPLRPDACRRRASSGDPRAGHSSRLHRLIPGLDRAVPHRTRALTSPRSPASRECAIDGVGLLVARLIVRVDLCRLRIGVTHPVLERSHRRARGRHPGPEGMAQLVEGDPVDLGAVDRLLEAANKLRAIERLAGLRVAEDEVAVARVDRL